ncbi:LysR substrate-binding domain-containing protein [Kosakonia sp.]|uniref:LysR family transcriptional regulator n=1 Tax=Kosakonia sp. TaxID=1916651 RepID=UPI00289F2E81|nr:LysR substrate-binding domain-containing protein [Kosakonia sp.]
MRYDLTTLSLFVAVAEEQNLTRAARRKHMAVSAASKRISELELQVGTPLLLRLPRGIELTPAGHSLLFHARTIGKNLAQMEEELGDYAAGVRGHIRICAIQAALMHHLPLALNRYLAAFPQTDIDIEERTGMGVVQGLLEGSVDVGFFSTWTTPAGLEVWPWREDSLAVLMAIEHPLAMRDTLRLSECAGEKMIGAHRDSTVSRMLEREAAKSGITLDINLRVSSFTCMAELARQGLGIALLPVNEVNHFTLHPALKCIPLEERWAKRELLVATRRYHEASPAAKSLIDHLTGGQRAPQ